MTLRSILKKMFGFWQSLGVHVTANHYYEPVPDTRELPESLWQQSNIPTGIDFNTTEQLDLLVKCSQYKKELDDFADKTKLDLSFGPVDSEMYYFMIRKLKPKRIIEIGSGSSIKVAQRAIEMNAKEDPNYSCVIAAVEPYPNEDLKNNSDVQLLEKKVQDVPLAFFGALEANDILFIDSSHVLKAGSDVQYEYLNILPNLNPGVFIHAHDIFLPREYPKDWIINQKRFWSEQYLLQAFLSYNNTFSVVWAANYMRHRHPDKFERVFSSFNSETEPGSFWIKRNA